MDLLIQVSESDDFDDITSIHKLTVNSHEMTLITGSANSRNEERIGDT